MGLIDSARGLVAEALALARTRFELFSTELQEELSRLFAALLCGIAALLLVVVAAIFAGLAVILALGEEQRPLAAGLIAGGFFVFAAAAAWAAQRFMRMKARMFEASLHELERDFESLKT